MESFNSFKQNTPEESSVENKENSIESKIESNEAKVEVIRDIRDKYGILFITCQPKIIFEKLGITEDTKWFREALGLPDNTDRLKVVHANEEPLPSSIDESGVIIGGSVHSVYEDSPWIRNLEEFIRTVGLSGKPMLGVCFGHQLIAQAMGGKVERGDKGRELGIANINLTEKGQNDSLFELIGKDFESATSHTDVVTRLPQIGRTAVLASNDRYSNQALSIGENIRTTQFHPEIDQDIIMKVVEARKQALMEEGQIQNEEEFRSYMERIRTSDIDNIGKQIIRNFDKNFILKYAVK